jgi:hypothetical protein
MTNFFSPTISQDIGQYRRRGYDVSWSDPGLQRLPTPLYSNPGEPRVPLITPTWKRKYIPWLADQVVNNLVKLSAATGKIPIGIQPELGYTPFRDRRLLVQMPYLYRPAIGANAPFVPPITPLIFDNPQVVRDKLCGQDFSNEIFLTPPVIHLTPVFLPDPYPRKVWLIPDFGSNGRLPLTALVVSPPFHQSDWNNIFARPKQIVKYDDPLSSIFLVAPTPSGPPFYQTDWPYVDWRLKLKEGTYFDWQNALIPNTKIPPTPPPPPTNIVGGSAIFGVFFSNRIFGVFGGGNSNYN